MEKQPKNMKISVVEEHDDGMYVWQTADGKIIADGEGNVMNILSHRGDVEKIEALKKAAKYYLEDAGMEFSGQAVFWGGRRRITDEQYEEQRARQAAGLTPDPFDVGAMQDDLKEAQHDGGRIR